MNKKRVQALALLLTFSAFCQLSACSTTTNSNTSSNATGESIQESDVSSNRGITYTVDTDTSALSQDSEISDTLYGLFLEDINFAVDGGLYSELIKNRSFEYGTAAANENLHGWVNNNEDTLTFAVTDGSTDKSVLNENNPHYATLTNRSSDYVGIGNVGYLDGLAVSSGASYQVSLYAKTTSGYAGSIRVALENSDGSCVYAENQVDGVTDSWQKFDLTLEPNATVNEDLRFVVEITEGSIDLDMVSLMPVDTYAGLPIRKDIGEYLESLNPSFLRFPGGCVIEGKDEESMYSWKDSIGDGLEFTINGETTTGDVAVRPQGKDIWSGTKQDPYYTTYGIGFYEYFELCEALDCMPVPVLNAGMTCQVQSPKYIVYDTDSANFKQCVQDALDLVEFCLGDSSTYWGGVRTAMGHPKTFDLTYIAIGNEQWQTEYHKHYQAFVKAFDQAKEENPDLYGNIQLIVANGTASSSTEGWTYLKENPDDLTTLVDEHYYNTPEWFFTNTKRYDSYDRSTQASVFLGEYAAQSNTLNAALAEAAYMTGLERNGDIVELACYAPLFGNSKTNQWTPDMMFFSNDSLYGSVDYYVQKLFSNNVGTNILPSSLDLGTATSTEAQTGSIGLGSWMTSVSYDNLSVTDNESGDTLYRCDFESDSTLEDDDWSVNEGEWSILDGTLVQSNTKDPFDTNTGDAIYVGDETWSNYTMTVDATVLSGNEGFLIPFWVKNTSNNYFWNIGGWGNTVSCLQSVSNNVKSDQLPGTVKNLTLKKNQTYQLKVIVDGCNVKCYIDDSHYVDYTYETADSLYETASVDANGDIILKLVNATEEPLTIQTVLDNFKESDYDTSAAVTTLSGEDLGASNSFDEPEKMVPVESTLTISENFTYEAPAYSVSILRIPAK